MPVQLETTKTLIETEVFTAGESNDVDNLYFQNVI